MSIRDKMTGAAELRATVERLEAKVADLEGQVAENAMLNHRFAELLDVVTELLLPATGDRADDPEARSRLESYVDGLGS